MINRDKLMGNAILTPLMQAGLSAKLSLTGKRSDPLCLAGELAAHILVPAPVEGQERYREMLESVGHSCSGKRMFGCQ